MGKIQTQWQQSLTRRGVLRSLSGFLAGSPLFLRAQQDPRPLREIRRVPGIGEMTSSLDFEPVFHANVPRAIYNYTAQGVDSEFTVRRNREAFEWVDIVAGATLETASVDLSSEILGTPMQHPILIAPTSGHQLVHPEGESATHRGAAAAGTPMIVSNVASLPIQEIADAASGPLWFQFYPKQDMQLSQRTLENAQNAGCQCIVVTIDQQTSYFTRVLLDRNLGGGRTSNRSRRRRTPPRNPYRVRDSRLWYEWEYFDQIRPFVKVPMLAKGVLSAEDAQRCLDYGLDGVIVSNHGGRSVDYAPSSLEVLTEIVDVIQGRIPVLIDSGFRRGKDMLKALALGADAICLGRVPRWGLGAFGAAGVQKVLELLQAELVQAMSEAGRPTLASLDRSLLRTDFP